MQGATFTPSVLDRAELERLFVVRHHLLDLAVSKIAAGATSTARSHLLLVGPRGAGKTHLISLIYYRAQDLAGYGTRFQVSWLPEDPWAVDTFDDLVTEILRNLEPERPGVGAGVDRLLAAVREAGPVVVFVENLDQVLDQIGPAGQRQLRALIENDRALLIIGTATRLSRDLVHQAVPFYGFFDVVDLPPFTVDDAVAMLKAMAAVRGDDVLPRRLDDPDIRARLLAVQRLAGGQPRIWALLGSGLTADRLDDLAATLAESFDDLTPYYQEQLARLSRHERRVVRALVDADRSMTVRALADATGIDPKSMARTMTDLRRRGWVSPREGPLQRWVDRRLTYYDLAEPLVRVVFQVKQARGKPILLLIDLLAAWFRGIPVPTSVDLPTTLEITLRSLSAETTVVEQIDREFRNALVSAPRPELAALLWRVDDALAGLQHRREASAVLDLPSAISLAIEADIFPEGELRDEAAVAVAAALLRLRLGCVAVNAGWAEGWLPRGQDAARLIPRSPHLRALAGAEALVGSRQAARLFFERSQSLT